ncbi:hypothetical protein GUJ93_ZPchr0013g37430 [Zizania palustris]|uniref:Uncharacterized protein n=1 Tax=Zizania palustris TaxID=103762 RepID=A0A8J5X2B2_ZIZPA|nr:hypothetical protein GUJ93_ZPchr0013g37430 [Zizania palustris]
MQPSDVSGASRASSMGDHTLMVPALGLVRQLPLQPSLEVQGEQIHQLPLPTDSQNLVDPAPSASNIPLSNELPPLDHSATQIMQPQSGPSKAIIVYQCKRQRPKSNPDALKIVPAPSLSVMPSSYGGLRRSARLRKKLQRSTNSAHSSKGSQLPPCPSLQDFIDLTSEDSDDGGHAVPDQVDVAPDSPAALPAPGGLAAPSYLACFKSLLSSPQRSMDNPGVCR